MNKSKLLYCENTTLTILTPYCTFFHLIMSLIKKIKTYQQYNWAVIVSPEWRLSKQRE